MSAKTFRVVVDGQTYTVEVEEIKEEAGLAAPSAPSRPLVPAAPPAVKAEAAPSVRPSGNTLTAPLQGTVLDIAVKAGDSVKPGDTLVVIEAMKMENEIVAPGDAVIDRIHVQKGDVVASGDLLVSFR
ncbi:MAG: biotin/lipoyl-containing protein [Saccharofermentanales bacterium]